MAKLGKEKLLWRLKFWQMLHRRFTDATESAKEENKQAYQQIKSLIQFYDPDTAAWMDRCHGGGGGEGMKKNKMERKVILPPDGFVDYEWDEDFKMVMFCLEFTRNEMSKGLPQEPHEAQEMIEEWGFKNASEIYDLLWGRFKYYKGQAFNKKFKIIEGNIDCPRCKNKIRMVEVKPGSISILSTEPHEFTKRKCHREICSLCHEVSRVDFWVPDRLWKLAIHISQQNNIICLQCFTRLADERGIQWDKGIKFFPTSRITFDKSIEQGEEGKE